MDRAPPTSATAPAPPAALADDSPPAAAARASVQPTGTSWPALRTIGSVSRRPSSSLLFTDSNTNRPLSHSQPWLTGSASMPSNRVSRLADDCTATRQPTAQPVHVDSTWSRSHGRAVNRYGVAVRAPTGQIWTVLPLKYDENGSPGKVATSTRSPRPAKSIWASPATSSANRVHRAHWMHRSRSIRTRSEMGTGFSKCRFSSTNRLSPGP